MRKASLRMWVLSGTPLLLAGVFILFELFFLADTAEGRRLGGQLNDVLKQAIAIELEVSKLFSASALAIIGVVAYYLKERRGEWTNAEFACAAAVLVSAVVSIFFGHLWMVAVRNQLEADIHDPYSPSRVWSERLQYLTLILSLGWFGLLVFRREFLESRSGAGASTPAGGGKV
ncbi:hypothetical protein [Corallococcus carmarthensis]|uniref:DUF4149 domain-containing protein n=1 Tax=Corallococcus carmarthensis TaxID=2316728 RepID=A0A3A8KHP6_9BACT|nr:hypothetical protein [Corallococcus carmarthensis]NOK22979.1 hypothetical protein [Corallococcus carmarthensis]RKH03845.1 hypothetical protein D7X32_12675 [Corallococcus carmarthensis]